MGEAKRRPSSKETITRLEQDLFRASAEIAIFRVMAGRLDDNLIVSIMKKLPKDSYNNFEDFFKDMTNAAKERMLELDLMAESLNPSGSASSEAPAEAAKLHDDSHISDIAED